MNVHEFDEGITCNECGKVFYDRIEKGKRISRFKQLAGHIMARRDHPYKRWAKQFLNEESHGGFRTGTWF